MLYENIKRYVVVTIKSMENKINGRSRKMIEVFEGKKKMLNLED